MEGMRMENIWGSDSGNYDGISFWYEKWCTGDEVYELSLKFYVRFLKKFSGPMLELGIGTGRIALELIKQKPVTLVGVDISEKMLEQCEKRYLTMKKNNLILGELKLVRGYFEEISYQNEFEAVYLPFRTIGHIMTDDVLGQLFQNVYRSLKKGGQFVFDHYIFQKQWAMEHNDVDIVMYRSDSESISDHYIYDFKNGYMKCSIKMNGTVVQKFMFRWIPPDTIRNIASRTGFKIKQCYGDFDETVIGPDALNQIWVLEK
jgi:SAM-dependent methyltransferase